jgi:hypothetical protein
MKYYLGMGGVFLGGVGLSAIFLLYVSPLIISFLCLAVLWAFVGATTAFLFKLSKNQG